MDLLVDDSVKLQVERLVERAKILTTDPFTSLNATLLERQFRIRPSVGSFSLISYSSDYPQLGFSGRQGVKSIANCLFRKMKPPGRPTPEKVLQASIIRSCVASGLMFRDLSGLLNEEFWFVSDEIALLVPARDNNGKIVRKKIVGDMLLARKTGSLTQLVAVELKTERTNDVFYQARQFQFLLDHNLLSGPFKEFASLMMGTKPVWDKRKGSKPVVIWPFANDPRPNPMHKDFHVVGYKDRYELIVER